jgi:hypothetical protein
LSSEALSLGLDGGLLSPSLLLFLVKHGLDAARLLGVGPLTLPSLSLSLARLPLLLGHHGL